MKKFCELFGEFLIHDTIYRTNKYGMIRGPFVGIDHHCKNILFWYGFYKNETIYSFLWLLKTFLMSMGSKHHVTLMTDQCGTMVGASREIFPNTWH